MKIILFRHGQKQKVDSIIADDKRAVKLTDFGIEQINQLGKTLEERFPKLKFSKNIYSSPYARTIQSGEIVKSILNIEKMILVPEFEEFYAFEDYSIKEEIRMKTQEKAMQNHDWISPDTGYSFNDVANKFKDKLKEICLNSENDLVLVSTHGGIVRNIVYDFEPKFRPSDELILDSKIHEAGYTIWNFDGKDFGVEEFDVHDYLDNSN